MTWLPSGTPSGPFGPPSAPIWPLIIAKPFQNRCKTIRGPNGGRRDAPIGAPVCPHLAPRLAANHCKTIAKPLQNRCKTRRGPNRARRGGGRKDYLLLKEKTTCSVYVSCKSSSASDVSDAGWLLKKFTVTNLPHCSNNVAIRHNDAT
jgi:hypothetical protein